MRFLEALGSAVVVALVVTVIAWRIETDMVLLPAVTGLATFVAVVLRTRSPGRAPSLRRPAMRRRTR